MLKRFRVLNTRSLGEFSESYRVNGAAAVQAGSSLSNKPAQFSVVTANRLSLRYASNALKGSVKYEESNQLRLVFCLAGATRIQIDGKEFDINRDTPGYILPPGRPITEHCLGRAEKLILEIDSSALRSKVAMLSEDSNLEQLEFEQPCRGDIGFFDSLRRSMMLAALEIEAAGTKLGVKLLCDMEEAFLCRAALYTKHSKSVALQRLRSSRGASSIGRFEQFIGGLHERGDSITVQEVAESLNVNERTLLRYFRKSYGVTPQQYIKQQRLRHARALLLADPNESVMSVALKCGFRSFGHFADAYSRQFGELPSSISKRSRRSKNVDVD